MTAPIQAILGDVKQVLETADGISHLPLQQELLHLSSTYLAEAQQRLSALCAPEPTELERAGLFERAGLHLQKEDKDDLSSIPPLEETVPNHLQEPEERNTIVGGSSSRRSTSTYNLFMSSVLPMFRAADPFRSQRANFVSAAALWQRHKALGDLDEILERCREDIHEMIAAEPKVGAAAHLKKMGLNA